MAAHDMDSMILLLLECSITFRTASFPFRELLENANTVE